MNLTNCDNNRFAVPGAIEIWDGKSLFSLGKARSHGSVRMANHDPIELAKFLMKESGTERSAQWYEEVLATPKK